MKVLENGGILGGECTVLWFSNTNGLLVPETSHVFIGHLAVGEGDVIGHDVVDSTTRSAATKNPPKDGWE